MISIKLKDSAAFLRLVHAFIRAMRLSASGQVSWDGASYDGALRWPMLIAVLGSKLEKSNGFTGDTQVAFSLVRHAIASLRRREMYECTWQDLEQAIQSAVDGYLEQPQKDFTILLPLHVDEASLSKKRWFRVLDTKVRLVSWPYVSKHLDWETFVHGAEAGSPERFANISVELRSRFVPCLVRVQRRRYTEAFRHAETRFNMLRAVLNMQFTFGFLPVIPFMSMPLGTIHPAPVYGVFGDSGTCKDSYFETEPYAYRRPPALSAEQLRAAEEFLRTLASITDDRMRQLICDVTHKYGNALDACAETEAFLTLWQILEQVALDESQRNTNVTGRIATLLGGADALVRELLEMLRDTRNDVVHRGETSEERFSDVVFLKFLVERALDALVSGRRLYPTENALQCFYTVGSLPDKRLAMQRRMVDAIIRDRHRSK